MSPTWLKPLAAHSAGIAGVATTVCFSASSVRNSPSFSEKIQPSSTRATPWRYAGSTTVAAATVAVYTGGSVVVVARAVAGALVSSSSPDEHAVASRPATTSAIQRRGSTSPQSTGLRRGVVVVDVADTEPVEATDGRVLGRGQRDDAVLLWLDIAVLATRDVDLGGGRAGRELDGAFRVLEVGAVDARSRHCHVVGAHRER